MFTAYVNLMYVGRPAVMVSAILAARHRTFVLVATSLFVLFVFPMHNKFLLLLLLTKVSIGYRPPPIRPRLMAL